MLAQLDSHTMIAVTDLGRARQFYEDRLGLTGAEEVKGLWVYAGSAGSVVRSASGQSAWFKDSEGNMLGLVQWIDDGE
jgi:catechol 2,3-dioxygenase-like lactoylglutathione lyase family enzyme